MTAFFMLKGELLLVLHNKKFHSYFNHFFSVFSPLKISPCLMDNVVDFGREKFSENLDQLYAGKVY